MGRVGAALWAAAFVCAVSVGGCAAGDDTEGAGGEVPDGSLGDAFEEGGFTPDAVGDTSCKPKTCAEAGINCGPLGDGCGGLLDCGKCVEPEFCGGGGKPSVCGTAPCTKKTCAELGATCGLQGDGCGGLIDCGTCVAPATCGGGGVPNTCGSPPKPDGGSCTPKTCVAMGFDCGPVADGCGALVDCGKCTSGTCGGGGFPNKCGSSTSPCLKKTCADWGANCGPVSDGCGGITPSCGTCTSPDICGGGGTPSVCGGSTSCVKKTCTDYPGSCGPMPDSCGGLTTSCGTCTSPATCGGGGTPSVCGSPPACVKKTCADFTGKCGPMPDGCGGLTTSCGTCTSPATCGGGGTPSVCGGGITCVKKTCADYPVGTCGPVSDGCGGLTTSCGTCTAPAICGGGGVASVCGGGSGTSCIGLACKQVKCTGTATTSISGIVYDPAGRTPLYNVFVYVPNGPVAAFTAGATCDKCADALSGFPLVTTVTDEKGKFKLDNMPVGVDMPVVIQTGKWRRQIKVTTTACVDTPVIKDLTRFPRDKSEGDIPKIAVSTGGFDSLECLIRKIGIADSEFTNPTGTGRVNLYQGMPPVTTSLSGGGKIPAACGAYSTGVTFPKSTTLWNDVTALRKYDVTLLACEGAEYGDPATETVLTSFPKKVSYFGTKSAAALKNMKDYTDGGGRVFASHYHYYWLKAGPTPWNSLASWGYNPDLTPLTGLIEYISMTFPKGTAMANWLVNVGGSTKLGEIVIREPQHSINSFDSTKVTEWIYASGAKDTTGATITHAAQYFSFNAPVGAATSSQCGRFVYSDIHVTAGDITDKPFPSGCSGSTTMSPQELALEFMFFDLASRVCDEKSPPPPPSCTPLTCGGLGYTCGSWADGCGGSLSCGTCPSGTTCTSLGKCGGSPCTPTTCTALGYTCGSWADGCGGSLSCGTCVAPGTCGGGGVPGKCGGSGCTASTCGSLGYTCGSWADGCGGTLTCGTCVPPATCGGGGVPGKCGGGSSCVPKTCLGLGVDCGSWADGCGGVLTCGTCVPPATCGGGGIPGKCGGGSCIKKTCAEMGVTCGPSGDGCGGTIDCGKCPTPDAGGGCVPLTCGGRCGPQGDGCGGILTCPPCDGGTCVPTTCAAAGAECGSYPDGCGGLLSCGTCVAPKTCGGSGVPNKCGGVG